MDNLRLFIMFAEYAITIGLTIEFFSYFSKKQKNFGRLSASVLIPVWVIIAFIKGIVSMYFENSYELPSIENFGLLLAEALPIALLVGGITFGIKYRKLLKQLN